MEWRILMTKIEWLWKTVRGAGALYLTYHHYKLVSELVWKENYKGRFWIKPSCRTAGSGWRTLFIEILEPKVSDLLAYFRSIREQKGSAHIASTSKIKKILKSQNPDSPPLESQLPKHKLRTPYRPFHIPRILRTRLRSCYVKPIIQIAFPKYWVSIILMWQNMTLIIRWSICIKLPDFLMITYKISCLWTKVLFELS